MRARPGFKDAEIDSDPLKQKQALAGLEEYLRKFDKVIIKSVPRLDFNQISNHSTRYTFFLAESLF